MFLCLIQGFNKIKKKIFFEKFFRIGNTAQQIRTRNERVWSVRWLNSNKYILATGSELGTLTLWDIRLTRCIS
jgi:WD40 repeat protein